MPTTTWQHSLLLSLAQGHIIITYRGRNGSIYSWTFKAPRSLQYSLLLLSREMSHLLLTGALRAPVESFLPQSSARDIHAWRGVSVFASIILPEEHRWPPSGGCYGAGMFILGCSSLTAFASVFQSGQHVSSIGKFASCHAFWHRHFSARSGFESLFQDPSGSSFPAVIARCKWR